MNKETAAAPQQITVLIADDHLVVREGLAALVNLETDLNVVAQAGNGAEALELWENLSPDVMLVDLKMPVMDGVATIAAVRAKNPAARIIVLTTFDGDEDIYRALRAGASGYLLKDVAPDVLLDAIRKVHKGQKDISPEMVSKLADRISGNDLTARELEILNLIVDGKTNQQISKVLHIAESTVKFHITNIFGKLAVNDRTQAVLAALKRGLVRL
jgi:DNA-binding NarL/FixJ family response regulator